MIKKYIIANIKTSNRKNANLKKKFSNFWSEVYIYIVYHFRIKNARERDFIVGWYNYNFIMFSNFTLINGTTVDEINQFTYYCKYYNTN